MSFHYHKDPHNIVTLTLDMPGRSANVINLEFGEGLRTALTQLLQEKTAGTLAGVIITSAKKSFMAGGDIDSLFAAEDPGVVFLNTEAFKAGLRQLETLGVPVVAALNGTALGGGLELALACHYRLALNQPGIKFGFPEVTLGLLPGGGGIARLTRLLGLQPSFAFLTEGTQTTPAEAKAAGLVHELAENVEEMMDKARAWIKANPRAKQPWDEAGYKMPGGNAHHPKVAQMVIVAPAVLRQKTLGNYPAPEAILSAAVEGSLVDFETASRIESRYFAQMVVHPTAKNMIQAFWYQLNQINNGESRPAGIDPQPTHKVGVLGAGMMGHGIAYVSAYAGLEVVLKDATLEKAEVGWQKIKAIMDKRVRSGKMSQAKLEEILGRIHPTADPAALQGCDLIIEAVFEDRALKAQVTQEAEAQIYPTAVLASNTSTLPITSLAQASARPENFIGLHFFSPVERMKLVEIIVGQQTSPQTLAKAFDYVLKIGKTPIVVNDSRGFYTSRVFGTYTMEGLALLGEGQNPAVIEAAGKQAGMPVGPLAVLDEVSLSLALHVRAQTRQDLTAAGQSWSETAGDKVLDVMAEAKRLGKAHGAGFYEYPAGGQKFLWPELSTRFPLNGHHPLTIQEMMERLMFIQALETVRCLEEGVLTSVASANIGSIFGWGFAPFKGGTLQYINEYGLRPFIGRAQELAQKYGERFTPPALLIQMAEKSAKF